MEIGMELGVPSRPTHKYPNTHIHPPTINTGTQRDTETQIHTENSLTDDMSADKILALIASTLQIMKCSFSTNYKLSP